MAVGLGTLSFLGVDFDPVVFYAGLFFFALGMGLAGTPATTAITASLPERKQGVASAVNDSRASSAARWASPCSAACWPPATGTAWAPCSPQCPHFRRRPPTPCGRRWPPLSPAPRSSGRRGPDRGGCPLGLRRRYGDGARRSRCRAARGRGVRAGARTPGRRARDPLTPDRARRGRPTGPETCRGHVTGVAPPAAAAYSAVTARACPRASARPRSWFGSPRTALPNSSSSSR